MEGRCLVQREDKEAELCMSNDSLYSLEMKESKEKGAGGDTRFLGI